MLECESEKRCMDLAVPTRFCMEIEIACFGRCYDFFQIAKFRELAEHFSIPTRGGAEVVCI